MASSAGEHCAHRWANFGSPSASRSSVQCSCIIQGRIDARLEQTKLSASETVKVTERHFMCLGSHNTGHVVRFL